MEKKKPKKRFLEEPSILLSKLVFFSMFRDLFMEIRGTLEIPRNP
jgi:hypothetical protein